MKTTLDLPADLMREVKIRAAQQGKKLKDVMAATIRSGLAQTSSPSQTTRPKITLHPILGFPMVECGPNAPAQNMSIEELLQLEQEIP